ncbi:hypothetical protein LTR02_012432 [Friedmanniomyces endolithicus]|nr:hypothetical protein LTR02_012432 [Friedmanniomyces endolithicus]
MPGYAGTLYAAGTLMIALRLWLRLTKQAGALGLDDALIVGAWLAGTMFTVDCFVAARDFHIGRHVWDIPLTDFENLALLSWLAEFSFLITGACIKISVLLFYRRLVHSPAEYEAYNLDVLRQGRNRYSVTGRPHADTIGRKASHRLSQPVLERLPP